MLKTIDPKPAPVEKTLTYGRTRTAEPMPRATIVLTCDECRQQIAMLSLTTTHLAQELFRLRKEHARNVHNWQELG